MKIGLVLSGGMAKGAYQIGVLKAISRFLKPDDFSVLSCASVGALNGYVFMTRQLDAAEQMWRDMCSEGTRSYINSILRSTYLQNSISRVCSSAAKIEKPFYIPLLDYKERTLVYRDMMKTASDIYPDYLRASVAMPLYNKPVVIGNQSFFDGAMIDNIPVFPLINHEPDIVICNHFDNYFYTFENSCFDKKVIPLIYQTRSVRESFLFSRNAIDTMIQSGFQQTYEKLYPIFSDMNRCEDQIYQQICCLRSSDGKKKLRLTGDMVTTNLNKITRRLTRLSIE